ncbi:hypothetical protein NQ318_011384 [Aromia moschata]|uniref:Retrotransposon gag domain-containing protein n=1 Tax=Aromia moschata TaxID=1265417 RepID=A0AAV8YTB7_9CUCU|nr:hypothetical protein NQ318_011384 [Aromia moschata]
MFGWSEDITIFNALYKLKGLALVWYKGLKSVNHLWEEWKQMLIRGFPSQKDFCDSLETMLRRRKRHDETFAQYFYEKQALLNACKIQGADAVSCIIGGINDTQVRVDTKAANCKDSEALFDYPRSLNTDVKTSSDRYVSRPKNYSVQNRKR